MTMTKQTLGYWAATGVAALAFAAGGVADLSGAPDVVAVMTHLGYPAYFATILGSWKLVGALAVLVPGFPRLKEWAYAGMAFDLTGAAASHAVVGDGVVKVAIPLALVALVTASWALRPASRKLEARAAATAAVQASQTSDRDVSLAV
jgi:uncharacterized membrane protein YphA (DoxX/SURF4 family)